MEWEIGDVTEENASGNLEFKIKGDSEDEFFPASVEFESEKTFMDVNVGMWFLIYGIGDEGGACGEWLACFLRSDQGIVNFQLYHCLNRKVFLQRSVNKFG